MSFAIRGQEVSRHRRSDDREARLVLQSRIELGPFQINVAKKFRRERNLDRRDFDSQSRGLCRREIDAAVTYD